MLTPANYKPKGLFKPLPIPERLWDKFTADVFYIEAFEEECRYTRQPIDGVFLMEDRLSGYIQILLCNTGALILEMASKGLHECGCLHGMCQVIF